MPSDFTRLITYLQLFHSVEKEDLLLFTNRLKHKSCKKAEILVYPDQVQTDLYLINRGVQMSYVDVAGKIHVSAFTYAPGLCAVPESFFHQNPSTHFLSCLTDGELWSISFQELQLLFDKSRPLERLFRKITETVLTGVIKRHVELNTLTIEDRYKTFCKRSPHLLQLVPHKYIASYLGIDATNFSKLYNSIRI